MFDNFWIVVSRNILIFIVTCITELSHFIIVNDIIILLLMVLVLLNWLIYRLQWWIWLMKLVVCNFDAHLSKNRVQNSIPGSSQVLHGFRFAKNLAGLYHCLVVNHLIYYLLQSNSSFSRWYGLTWSRYTIVYSWLLFEIASRLGSCFRINFSLFWQTSTSCLSWHPKNKFYKSNLIFYKLNNKLPITNIYY